MYRARFADVVPVDLFPAVAFLQPDGGHVHVAYANNNMPDSAEQLYSDLYRGFQFVKSTKDKEAVQSTEDCVDGNCKPNEVEGRRPVLRGIRDMFGEKPSKEGLVYDVLWGGWATTGQMLAIAALSVIAFVMTIGLVVMLIRR